MKYTRFVVTAVVGGSIMVTKNQSGNFYNGEVYTLHEVDGNLCIGDKHSVLPYDWLESTGDNRLRINQWITALATDRVEIPIQVPVFQEANVMTIHKSQGQTLTGNVAVVLSSRSFCSKQMLYTAATRCRNVENLRVYADLPFDKKFEKAPRAKLSMEKSRIIAILKKKPTVKSAG
jgi:ATP-dependent exoDNAse (exonuclease V) alpha subunit